MAAKLDAQTGWFLCRNLQETAVPCFDMLQRWAERGRVRPDDYLVNPRLEICLQAKEIPDLEAIFRKQRLRCLEPILRMLSRWRVMSTSCESADTCR